MLFRTLDNLRQKPKAVRQRVAFLTALSFTLVVGGIWTLSLPGRFAPDTLAQSEGTKPFAGLWTGFRDQFSSIKQQAGVIMGVVASSTATTTATSSTMIDIATLIATSTPIAPRPVPILIGTTSATTSSSTSE